MPVVYEGINLEVGFRADIVVDNILLIETKSIEHILPVHHKIVLTYLKISGMKLGLLINFHEALIKDGIYRKVNQFAS